MNIEIMKLALNLAKQGEGKVNPNPMVGAIVVKNGKIIGTGFHKYFGGPHAEVYALDEAKEEAKGADIYVTLEPCSHYGKTPPCVDKIINSGIKRCFIATIDPNPLVSGKGIEKLKSAGIEVFIGICEEEAKNLNKVFFKYITKKIPYVFLKVAITIDGKIATYTGDSKWISNEKARNLVQILRNRYMADLVGINTVLKDNPNLTCRINLGRNPYRIIIDSYLKIPLNSNLILNNQDNKTIIFTSEKCNSDKKDILIEKGIRIITVETSEINEKPIFKMEQVLKKLGEIGIDSVIVEGGSKIISSFLKENLIDEGVIFIAPKILGNDGIPLAENMNFTKISEAINLKNINFEILEDNIAVWFLQKIKPKAHDFSQWDEGLLDT